MKNVSWISSSFKNILFIRQADVMLKKIWKANQRKPSSRLVYIDLFLFCFVFSIFSNISCPLSCCYRITYPLHPLLQHIFFNTIFGVGVGFMVCFFLFFFVFLFVCIIISFRCCTSAHVKQKCVCVLNTMCLLLILFLLPC